MNYRDFFLCKNIDTRKLHRIIYSLFYPAVLGSLLMLFVNAVFKRFIILGSFHFWMTLFLVLYFAAQYVVNIDANANKNRLNCIEFIIGVIEIVIMYSLFYFLGVTEHSTQTEWCYFYVILCCMFFLPILSRMIRACDDCEAFNNTGTLLTLLSFLAMMIALFGLGFPTYNFILWLLYILYMVYIPIFLRK